MKVILTSDIDDIGFAGEIKVVKNGLARNYLIPKSLAIEATATNIRDWEKRLENLRLKREKVIADAERTAGDIEGKVITMEFKVSSGEKMFGSVTAQTIADALKEQHGITVEKRNILLEKNIKSVGTHDVPVRIKGHIKATVIVDIKPDKEEEIEEETAMEAPPEQTETETAEAAAETDAGDGTAAETATEQPETEGETEEIAEEAAPDAEPTESAETEPAQSAPEQTEAEQPGEEAAESGAETAAEQTETETETAKNVEQTETGAEEEEHNNG